MTIWTKQFWQGAAERGVKTFLQTFVAVVTIGVGADAIGASAGIGSIDWRAALSVSAVAAVLSLATSVGNADFTAGTNSANTASGDTYTVNGYSAEDVAAQIGKAKGDVRATHAPVE